MYRRFFLFFISGPGVTLLPIKTDKKTELDLLLLACMMNDDSLLCARNELRPLALMSQSVTCLL